MSRKIGVLPDELRKRFGKLFDEAQATLLLLSAKASTLDMSAAMSTKADTSYVDAQDSAKAATAHTHPESDIIGLVTDLAGKSAVGHTHTIASVTGLQTALDGKASLSHTHAIADVTGLQTALDAKLATADMPVHTGQVTISFTALAVQSSATLTAAWINSSAIIVVSLSGNSGLLAGGFVGCDAPGAGSVVVRMVRNGLLGASSYTVSVIGVNP